MWNHANSIRLSKLNSQSVISLYVFSRMREKIRTSRKTTVMTKIFTLSCPKRSLNQKLASASLLSLVVRLLAKDLVNQLIHQNLCLRNFLVLANQMLKKDSLCSHQQKQYLKLNLKASSKAHHFSGHHYLQARHYLVDNYLHLIKHKSHH